MNRSGDLHASFSATLLLRFLPLHGKRLTPFQIRRGWGAAGG